MKILFYLMGALLLMPLPAIAQANPPRLLAQLPAPRPLFTVTPVNQQVSIRVINETGAPIGYEAVTDTAPRSLAGNSEITLLNLSTPTSLFFRREDFGLLEANLRSTTPGVLELRLSATTDFSRDRTALTIDQTGGVFLY